MTFIIIFLILLICGYGLVSILVYKTILDDILVKISLAPVVSLAFFSLFAIYELGLNISLYASYSILLIAMLLLLFRRELIRNDFIMIKHYLIDKKNIIILFSFFSIVAFLMFFFGTENGSIRHGLSPDIAAYLSAMNHFTANGTSLNTKDPFSNEILNKALRWRIPFCASKLKMITSFPAYNVLVSLILVVFVFGSLAIARIHVLLNNLQKNRFVTLLIFISLVGNVALLDFFYEGFYPQIISIICFGLVLSLFHVIRSTDEHNSLLFLTILFLFIIILSAYSELFVLGIAFVFGVVLFDFIQKNKNNFNTSLMLGMTIIGALMVSLPLSNHIYEFTIANSSNFRNIGYPLPGYMFPSDWLGISNIFSDSSQYLDDAIATHVVVESRYPLLVKIILSIIAILVFIRYTYKNQDKSIILVIAVGISAFFAINVYLNHFHGGIENYLYNKLSSTFILYLTVVFFTFLLKEKYFLGFASLLLISLYSSNLYIKDSYKYYATIESDLIQKFQDEPQLKKYIFVLNERGYRNGQIIGKIRYIDRTDEFMLRGLLGIYALDQWNLADRVNMPNYEIILLTKKEYIDDHNKFDSAHKILFETKNYIAFHTGVTLNEIPSSNEGYAILEKKFVR